MTYQRIDRCRACRSTNLNKLFSLGELYVSNFVAPGRETQGPKVPLELVHCQNCTLVQLGHTVPPAELYTDQYWYRSGVTATMRAALKDVTNWVIHHRVLELGDVVVDIGSNDGTLLRNYPDRHRYTTVGFEPAKNLADEGREGVQYFVNELWSAEGYRKLNLPPARVVTALGMLYDLEDPLRFLTDVREVLHPEGWFIAQFMTLKNMLDVSDLGNIAHEHLEYYSLYSLQALFRKAGLKVIGMEENDVNGRSTRFYLRHETAPVPAWMALERSLWLIELGLEVSREFDVPVLSKEFFGRMLANREATVDHVRGAVSRGEKVYVYGASTKGNTILQWYGLDKTLLAGAAERSPEKWGKVTVGTGIPIVPEEEARERADYFLVLPYAFLPEFIEREREWFSRGGKFLVPLPYFRVVGRDG